MEIGFLLRQQKTANVAGHTATLAHPLHCSSSNSPRSTRAEFTEKKGRPPELQAMATASFAFALFTGLRTVRRSPVFTPSGCLITTSINAF